MLLRAILGVEPNAGQNLLHFNPTLPDWLPDITIRGLRVGNERLSIRFAGEGTASRGEVLEGGGRLMIKRG